jgi:hypothetical protein
VLVGCLLLYCFVWVVIFGVLFWKWRTAKETPEDEFLSQALEQEEQLQQLLRKIEDGEKDGLV